MMRYSFITINGVRISHEEQGGLYFEADYNSGKPNEVGSMVFKIYNLAQDIEIGSIISYDFGRGDFGGRFGTFTVKKRNVSIKGSDMVQELFCSERAMESSNIVSVSLKGQITSSQAIREICKSAGLTAVQVELTEDKVYPTSYSSFGKAYDELKKIADNCSSKFKIENRDVYFYKDNPEQKSIVNLTFDSGLITNPKAAEELTLDKESENKAQNGEVTAAYSTNDKIKTTNTNKFDFSLECLSIHTLKKGTMVSIDGTKTFNGIARIYSVEMNNAEKWVMKLKIKKL